MLPVIQSPIMGSVELKEQATGAADPYISHVIFHVRCLSWVVISPTSLNYTTSLSNNPKVRKPSSEEESTVRRHEATQTSGAWCNKSNRWLHSIFRA
jgi:hypothetical protein